MISNFKKNWTLTLAVSAWILIPPASRAAAATAAIPDPHDLSYEEIRSAVKDFGADVNAEKGTVTLRGFIYKACLDQIEIRTKESTGRVDYIIRDVGNLKGCLAEQKKRHPAERLGNEAVFARLSKLPAAVITAMRTTAISTHFSLSLQGTSRYLSLLSVSKPLAPLTDLLVSRILPPESNAA